MNTPEQIAAVKSIIKIKKRILHSSDWDEIAALMQSAVKICSPVGAYDFDKLDKTRTKAWNIISVRRIIKCIKEKTFTDAEALQSEISASLLRLSMSLVKAELEDVNQILANSLLNNTTLQSDLQRSSNIERDHF